jgi:hypothetical protein
MKEKPKNKPSQLKKLIGLSIFMLITFAGCFLFLAKALSGIGEWDSPIYDLRGEEAREAIEAYHVSVPLPVDAQDFYMYYFAMRDSGANIRFSASPESIEEWLTSNDFCFTELIPNADLYDSFGIRLDWWQPNIGRHVSSRRCGSNGTGFQIAIDQNNSDLWIVYLVIMR